MVDDIKAVNAFMAGQQTGSLDNSTDTSMLDCDYIMGSTVPNQPAGIFWAVVNELLILAQIAFLILSEIGWPAVFFDRFFPVLGKDFGVGALGVFQCLIGAAILSHKVDDFALVAAFFLFAIGCLNILVVCRISSLLLTRLNDFAFRVSSSANLLNINAPSLPGKTLRRLCYRHIPDPRLAQVISDLYSTPHHRHLFPNCF